MRSLGTADPSTVSRYGLRLPTKNPEERFLAAPHGHVQRGLAATRQLCPRGLPKIIQMPSIRSCCHTEPDDRKYYAAHIKTRLDARPHKFKRKTGSRARTRFQSSPTTLDPTLQNSATLALRRETGDAEPLKSGEVGCCGTPCSISRKRRISVAGKAREVVKVAGEGNTDD
jgi:hypothetical protein